ncbi:MAG: polysaccharide deacetylase family protein [Chitinophagaceae bacterium]|nr:polysaccharide deacetylase family protein [Chitinophagaceae bacterium]
MENKIHIFSPISSTRLNYILTFIFEEQLGISFQLYNEKENFEKQLGLKINYSNREKIISDIHILPHYLLFENEIQMPLIQLNYWMNEPIFFSTPETNFPFDIFAASFFLISRYEEYVSYTPDLYQRFPAEKSVAFQYNFLKKPLVDFWLIHFKSLLKKIKPEILFKENTFSFTPTYDIDIAYSFKHKGLKRTLGGIFNDFKEKKYSSIKERFQVLFFGKKDPYDAFELLNNLDNKYSFSPIYFFLLGKNDVFDKNILPQKKAMQSLIKNISKKNTIGIHPSYASNDKDTFLQNELEILEKNCEAKIISSRQHYIRFEMPITFRKLISLGILKDYSMGYGSVNGFRASTSNSFLWFDLLNNESTKLRLFPFCFMEANSFYEQKQNVVETEIELDYYLEICKKVNGNLITIWHNFSLGTEEKWNSWSALYEKFLEKINTLSL